MQQKQILLGKGTNQVSLLARYANRHGLIAGATGTGKTVSLMLLAEGFSRMGVPVFIADVKGDVSGLAAAGTPSEKLLERAQQIGIENYAGEANPVIFWDLFGKTGHPVRATVSEIGPSLLARILELNDVQTGMLEIAFKLADDNGWLLLDLDDLRALLNYLVDHRREVSRQYGLITAQSIAAVQRSLLALQREGVESFLGEPALELGDLMRTDLSGRGIINILAADQLILKPRLYSSLLLWLLSELFENLPEVGDQEQPRLVFFFDEAHLLFDDAPASLRRRVEQVVRIIRSKGVGVYFCSQFPDDIPNEILGQLGNRIQHALRAFTPRDQKAVKTAAETFAINPNLDVAAAITQLAVGEALVSTLQEKGIPLPVERALISPPRCRMGAITEAERDVVRSRSPVGAKYDRPVNRESAYEMLERRAMPSAAPAQTPSQTPTQTPAPSAPTPQPAKTESGRGRFWEFLWGTKRRQGMVETLAKQTARTVGGQIGRKIVRGVLGGIQGSRRR